MNCPKPKSVLFILLLLFAPAAASAQTRLTIDQLEQILARLPGNDSQAAAQISPYQLTERVSFARLTQGQSKLKGPHTRDAFLVLADASAFQPLPPSELPAIPPPDASTQAAILNRTTEYVAGMRRLLPNFTALHNVTRFEVASRAEMEQEERVLQFQQMSNARLHLHTLGHSGMGARDLYLLGTTTSDITVRDGAEVRSPVVRKKDSLDPSGFTSWGEFGPILLVVNGDAAHGHINWDHWENSPTGPLAVFRYQVPMDQSHFATYSVLSDFPGIAPRPHYPGYHGEISINPADGTILRIAVLADAEPQDPSAVSAVVVEYGPVAIGGRNYICPLHTIAISAQSVSPHNAAPAVPGDVRKYINDGSFTDYHVFRADSRVVPETKPSEP